MSTVVRSNEKLSGMTTAKYFTTQHQERIEVDEHCCAIEAKIA